MLICRLEQEVAAILEATAYSGRAEKEESEAASIGHGDSEQQIKMQVLKVES